MSEDSLKVGRRVLDHASAGGDRAAQFWEKQFRNYRLRAEQKKIDLSVKKAGLRNAPRPSGAFFGRPARCQPYQCALMPSADTRAAIFSSVSGGTFRSPSTGVSRASV